jgi:hypothetical protein
MFSTILNNATAQYFPVATHAADTKQFKFNITSSNESQYTAIEQFLLRIVAPVARIEWLV